ncbi:hypothetical protein WS67_02350 [Burkholderia singularis]|uniref:Uncharacterized protein n=1 Tax=Burkholderia singularis TaxID=1503053 RepID=A0A103DV78_9BURK|nr:hypothetical protein WS67_02350 [Burkholderia singularis]
MAMKKAGNSGCPLFFVPPIACFAPRYAADNAYAAGVARAARDGLGEPGGRRRRSAVQPRER